MLIVATAAIVVTPTAVVAAAGKASPIHVRPGTNRMPVQRPPNQRIHGIGRKKAAAGRSRMPAPLTRRLPIAKMTIIALLPASLAAGKVGKTQKLGRLRRLG